MSKQVFVHSSYTFVSDQRISEVILVFILLYHLTCSKEAQRCYCGASNCRGTIGGTKATPLKGQQEAQEETPEKKEKERKKKRKDIFDDAYVSSLLPEKK